MFCPAVETDPITGEAKVAQVGLRRIEAALHQGYKKDEVFVANPEHLKKIYWSRYQSCWNKCNGSTWYGTCHDYNGS